MDELFLNKVSSVLGINRLFINQGCVFSGSNNLSQRQCWRGGVTRKQHLLSSLPSPLIPLPESYDWTGLHTSILSSDGFMIAFLHFCKRRTRCCPWWLWSDLSRWRISPPRGVQWSPGASWTRIYDRESRTMSPGNCKANFWEDGRITQDSPKEITQEADKILETNFTRRGRKDSGSTRMEAQVQNTTGKTCFFTKPRRL